MSRTRFFCSECGGTMVYIGDTPKGELWQCESCLHTEVY